MNNKSVQKEMFIDDKKINDILSNAQNVTKEHINHILDKAEAFEGLTTLEVASILQSNDKDVWDRVYSIADLIKRHIYGDRVVMFAPLYVSDYCVNKCEYCGFSYDNKTERKKLTMLEIKKEVEILQSMGHKRLALEAGEDPVNCSIEYILECLQTIYSLKFDNGAIRRVNVNIASTTVENFKKLADAEIGTYILFQETYHRETYERIHLKGPKANYEYHLTAFDRAMQAGIEDVGAGVLFGFYDYKYEVIALMLHNEHLENTYGVGFHTISVPRLCEAEGNDVSKYEHILNDETFIKLVALLRLAVPFTGLILSTRESKEMRKELINKGVSQVSGGSSVEVGGYNNREKNATQFEVSDTRSSKEITEWLIDEDLLPSFCTACYRQGRTGDRFMELAKNGNIKNVCLPNGLLTLKEYGLDYGDDEFRKKSDKLIQNKIKDIEDEKTKKITLAYLERLENGERDLFL